MTLRLPWLPGSMFERTGSGAIANSARIGTPPEGESQWSDIARAQNWLLCGGSMQLGAWGPMGAVEGGDTLTLRGYAWPRPQCFARLWTFVTRGAGAHGVVETADEPSGKAFANRGDLELNVFHIPEVVTDTTPTGEEITVNVTMDAGSPVILIMSVTCTEIPLKRAAMSGDSTGLGVHESTLTKWHPIAELDESSPSTTDQTSVTGVMRVADSIYTGQHAHRRAKIFGWHSTDGVTLSSSTFTNLFRVNPSCQTRQVFSGETSRTCRWAVYASASASAGEVRVTSSITGATSTITVNSATPAWYSADIAVATDDTSATGWVRGSRETLTFERRATSGDIVMYAIEVGER